jgi:heterodisulfide reductase subunit C
MLLVAEAAAVVDLVAVVAVASAALVVAVAVVDLVAAAAVADLVVAAATVAGSVGSAGSVEEEKQTDEKKRDVGIKMRSDALKQFECKITFYNKMYFTFPSLPS